MYEALNSMIKEQFGTGPIPEKTWYVITDDTDNLANVPVTNGRFHPAIMLSGVHSETKAGAAATYSRCCHRRVYGVAETIEEAKEIMKYGTIILWNGRFVRKSDADYE